MTRYRFDNQARKEALSSTRAATIALLVVGIFLLITFVLAPVARRLARGPEWLAQVSIQSAGESVTMMTPKRMLVAEVNRLREAEKSRLAQAAELEVLRSENRGLRAELSYAEIPGETMAAGVIGKPSQSLHNSLILDRGSDNGVVAGQLVTAQGFVALGRVAIVTARTATVLLFSGPQFDGSLVIKNQNITVPATGRGGGNFEIHIPREIDVKDGDVLTFPDQPNLSVGVVKSVEFDPRDPFQTVLARTPVNVQELRFVEIVK